MKDVIVDTGRHGGYGSKRKKPRQDTFDRMDCLPPQEGMRRLYRDYKEFGDRINPLRKYIMSQVGRPWNDVWSDICKHADVRNIRGWHLREHARREVISYADWSDPGSKQYRWLPAMSLEGNSSFDVVYEDKNGILRLHKGIKYKRKKKEHTYITISGKDYKKINGCWFVITEPGRYEYRRYRHKSMRHPNLVWGKEDSYDSIFLKDPSLDEYMWGYTLYHFVEAKQKQLSTKELKRIGLKNDNQ